MLALERQKKILELILQNKTNEEISIELNYSRSTVKRRIKELQSYCRRCTAFTCNRQGRPERTSCSKAHGLEGRHKARLG